MSLPTVRVLFEDPSYNYATNVAADVTEDQARAYFVGQTFDVGVYPAEDLRRCKGIEFFANRPSSKVSDFLEESC